MIAVAQDRLGAAILRSLDRGRTLNAGDILSIVCGMPGLAKTSAAEVREWLCGHPESVDLSRNGWVLRVGVAAPQALPGALADPAVRAKMSAARKAAWADPAVRAKMSAARKAALADPAVRAKMSAASKAAWADPAVRAKMSAASKAALADKGGPAIVRALRARGESTAAELAVYMGTSEGSVRVALCVHAHLIAKRRCADAKMHYRLQADTKDN